MNSSSPIKYKIKRAVAKLNFGRLRTALCIFLLLASLSVSAQENDYFEELPRSESGFKILPQNLFWANLPLSGEYGGAYELRLRPKISMQLYGAYVSRGLVLMMIEAQSTDPRIVINGFHFNSALRFYFRDEAISGLYLEPDISYAQAKYYGAGNPGTTDYLFGKHIDYAFGGGFQKSFMGKLLYDINVGLVYRDRTWLEVQAGKITPFTEEEIESMYLQSGVIRLRFKFMLGFKLN